MHHIHVIAAVSLKNKKNGENHRISYGKITYHM